MTLLQLSRILIIGHLLGDFYMQSETLATKKHGVYRAVCKHSAYYSLFMTSSWILCVGYQYVHPMLLCCLAHWMVDSVKYKLIQSFRIVRNHGSAVFIVDQITHILLIAAILSLYRSSVSLIDPRSALSWLSSFVGISPDTMTKYILAFLLIGKPTNICIQVLIGTMRPKQNNPASDLQKLTIDRQNTGRKIGTVERVVMLLLMTAGQYSTIAIVLTAKSIARVDQIQKEKGFADYYLLGTLMSTASAIMCSYMIR